MVQPHQFTHTHTLFINCDNALRVISLVLNELISDLALSKFVH